MKFKIKEEFSRREIENARLYIARLCGTAASGIMVFNNGRFEIHQVNEMDAGLYMNRLSKSPKIKDLNKVSTSYDFSHYVGFGIPKQYYTISGQIIIKPLVEYLTPILEENEQYHIRYNKQGNQWQIQVFTSSDEEVKSIFCDSIIDRDRELEYLKNDYQTMDCCELK